MVEKVNTILLVEDEALIAMAERIMLERYGYQVIVAPTGEAALSIIFSNSEIGLVLMDIDLGPGMDGTETAVEVLKVRHVPVVFLSSHTEREVVEKTEGITSYGYIVKNSGETVLTASVKMAFRLHQSRIELGESEERYRALFDNLADAVFVANADTGMILDANPRAEELAGRNRSALLRMHQSELHPPQRHSTKVPSAAVLEETEVVRADGREVPTEIAALGTYTMRNTRYHVGVYRDISDRKRTEQALVRSEKLYRTLMENSADGIKLINRDGAILNANRAAWEMLGYSRDELLALTVPEIDPDWSRERFQTFWDTRATPQPVFVQTHHRHRNGTLIPVEITAIPCDLDDERFVFGISRDISLRLA